MNFFATQMQQNNALAALSEQAGPQVSTAVHNASARSGVDFGYLLQQAKVESSFDIDAQAKTSSARGLYQFIESTWMDMVDKYGDKYGIKPGQSRSALLKLRDDPRVSAHMAAEFAGENKASLERNWGGEVGSTELYLAHFMGAGGAASFLKAKDANPLQPAAELFERAAAANKSIFYERGTNRAKTLQEVYDRFAAKFDDFETSPAAAQPRTDQMFAALENATAPLQSFSERVAARRDHAPLTHSLFRNHTGASSASAGAEKLFRITSADFISLFKTV